MTRDGRATVAKLKALPIRSPYVLVTAGGGTGSIAEGIAVAHGAIDSGGALEKLEKLKEITNK